MRMDKHKHSLCVVIFTLLICAIQSLEQHQSLQVASKARSENWVPKVSNLERGQKQVAGNSGESLVQRSKAENPNSGTVKLNEEVQRLPEKANADSSIEISQSQGTVGKPLTGGGAAVGKQSASASRDIFESLQDVEEETGNSEERDVSLLTTNGAAKTTGGRSQTLPDKTSLSLTQLDLRGGGVLGARIDPHQPNLANGAAQVNLGQQETFLRQDQEAQYVGGQDVVNSAGHDLRNRGYQLPRPGVKQGDFLQEKESLPSQLGRDLQQGQESLSEKAPHNQQSQFSKSQHALSNLGQQSLSDRGQQSLPNLGQQSLSDKGLQPLHNPGQQFLSNQGQQTLSNESQQSLSNPSQQYLSIQGQRSLSNESQQSLSNPGQQSLSSVGQQSLSSQAQSLLNQSQQSLSGQRPKFFANQDQQSLSGDGKNSSVSNQGQQSSLGQGQKSLIEQGQQSISSQSQQLSHNHSQQFFSGQSQQSLSEQDQQSVSNQGQQSVSNLNEQSVSNQSRQTSSNQGQQTLSNEGQQALPGQFQQFLRNNGQQTLSDHGQPPLYDAVEDTGLSDHKDQENDNSQGGGGGQSPGRDADQEDMPPSGHQYYQYSDDSDYSEEDVKHPVTPGPQDLLVRDKSQYDKNKMDMFDRDDLEVEAYDGGQPQYEKKQVETYDQDEVEDKPQYGKKPVDTDDKEDTGSHDSGWGVQPDLTKFLNPSLLNQAPSKDGEPDHTELPEQRSYYEEEEEEEIGRGRQQLALEKTLFESSLSRDEQHLTEGGKDLDQGNSHESRQYHSYPSEPISVTSSPDPFETTDTELEGERDDWYDDPNSEGEDEKTYRYDELNPDGDSYTAQNNGQVVENDADWDKPYRSDVDVFEEDVVDPDMVKKDKQPIAPSHIVLFYTWMVVAVLIMVVSVSTYQTRCKSLRSQMSKGPHSEDRKRLLEHEFA